MSSLAQWSVNQMREMLFEVKERQQYLGRQFSKDELFASRMWKFWKQNLKNCLNCPLWAKGAGKEPFIGSELLFRTKKKAFLPKQKWSQQIKRIPCHVLQCSAVSKEYCALLFLFMLFCTTIVVNVILLITCCHHHHRLNSLCTSYVCI